MVERMCHVCRAMRPKSALIRVVRTPDGAFCVDAVGKIDGRGCYVCREGDCVAKGVKSRYLNRAFKCVVEQEVYQEVVRYAGEQ